MEFGDPGSICFAFLPAWPSGYLCRLVWSWQRIQQQARKINEELAAGVIEFGKGEVVFQGGEY